MIRLMICFRQAGQEHHPASTEAGAALSLIQLVYELLRRTAEIGGLILRNQAGGQLGLQVLKEHHYASSRRPVFGSRTVLRKSLFLSFESLLIFSDWLCAMLNTPVVGGNRRGTSAPKVNSSWKKCLQRLMPVSRVGQKLAALRTSKAFALLKKQPPRFAFNNFHSLTFHPASRCRAAVNKASGVIALTLFPPMPRIYKGRQ